MWDGLAVGWQSAFGEAWSAYKRGANPIGCSIVNDEGQVIACGQNRTRDDHAPENQICANNLAHAEINAMLQINNKEHENIQSYTLYTTLEPCIQCFGAFYLSGIRNLSFAAREPSGGSTNVVGKTEYLSKKEISINGPLSTLEAVQIVLRYDWAFENDIRSVIEKERQLNPIASEVGGKLLAEKTIKRMKDQNGDIRTVIRTILEELNRFGFEKT